MIAFPKKFRTNGDITKFLLKIARDPSHTEVEIREAAMRAMKKFPLSSHKMLYDDDLKGLGEMQQRALIDAAVATDNEKVRSTVFWLVDLGKTKKEALKDILPFGRASIKDV